MRNDLIKQISIIVREGSDLAARISAIERVLLEDPNLDTKFSNLMAQFYDLKNEDSLKILQKFCVKSKLYLSTTELIRLTAKLYKNGDFSKRESLEYLAALFSYNHEDLLNEEIELLEDAKEIFEDTKEGFFKIGEGDSAFFEKLLSHLKG